VPQPLQQIVLASNPTRPKDVSYPTPNIHYDNLCWQSTFYTTLRNHCNLWPTHQDHYPPPKIPKLPKPPENAKKNNNNLKPSETAQATQTHPENTP
jgi:hypothetical protein